jgi:hypothetical protein
MADRFDNAKRSTTTATVQVTLDIPVPGKWGGDCALGQALVQAEDEAMGILRRVFKDQPVEIVGTPIVSVITHKGTAR